MMFCLAICPLLFCHAMSFASGLRMILSLLKWRNMIMYLKNLNHRMTLRLDDELLAFVNSASEIYGISPSDFIRQCICSVKYGFDAARLQMNDNSCRRILENGFDRKESIDDQL